MPSFNRITIVGYLGRDAEQRFTPQGLAVASFSVATTDKRRDKETTTWFRCTLFGKQAEAVAQYLTKGKLVFVEGQLRQEEYTNKDGQTKTSLEVNVTSLQLLGGKDDTPRAEAARPAPAGQVPGKSAASRAQDRHNLAVVEPTSYPDDDDIPF